MYCVCLSPLVSVPPLMGIEQESWTCAASPSQSKSVLHKVSITCFQVLQYECIKIKRYLSLYSLFSCILYSHVSKQSTWKFGGFFLWPVYVGAQELRTSDSSLAKICFCADKAIKHWGQMFSNYSLSPLCKSTCTAYIFHTACQTAYPKSRPMSGAGLYICRQNTPHS